MTGESLSVASARHLAYAPQYAARELGFFSREGLDVDLVACPVGDTAIIHTLQRGEADLVLGSVLFALRMAEEGLSPRVVAQSNQQTRHWLMARGGSAAPFEWTALSGRSVLVYPNAVPTPWVAFREALVRKGICLDGIGLIIGYSAEQALAEFSRGVGDFLLVDPESVDPRLGLVEAASVAAAIGPVPWSVYCTTSAIAARRENAIAAFRSAVAAAAAWLYASPAAEAAALLAGLFPERGKGELSIQVARYVRARLWVADARMDAAQFVTWDAALKRDGLMPRGLDLMQLCGPLFPDGTPS